MFSFLHRMFTAVFLAACFAAVLAYVAGIYLITTSAGGKAAMDFLLKYYVPAGATVHIGSTTGNICSGMTLQDIRIENLPGLPPATSFRVQRLDIYTPILNPIDISVIMFNGRLLLPGGDPLIVEGAYAKGHVQGRAYSRVLDVRSVVGGVMEEKYLKNLEGYVTDAQLSFEGPAMTLRVVGTFFVDRIRFMGTTVSQGPGRVKANLVFGNGKVLLEGDMMMESGLVNTRNRDIDLRFSKATFKDGVLNDPILDIHGNTQVENISIDIAITGTMSKPVLKLNSNPPLSEDVLWLVLAGGKTWMPALEKSDEDKSLDIKKRLSDDFKVGLGLQQNPIPVQSTQQAEYSKKLEGEMLLSDRWSVNVGQEILHEQNTSATRTSSPTDPRSQNESEIFLKYKNRF